MSGLANSREWSGEWSKDMALAAMEQGLMAKFHQNPHFARILAQTGNATLVFASPYCLTFKNGLSIDDENCNNPEIVS